MSEVFIFAGYTLYINAEERKEKEPGAIYRLAVSNDTTLKRCGGSGLPNTMLCLHS
jgi:hypothetical protein